MSFKEIFISTNGRINRLPFLGYSILQGGLILLIGNFISLGVIGSILLNIISFVIWIPLVIKREHDRNFSGKKKLVWLGILTIIITIFPLLLNIGDVKINNNNTQIVAVNQKEQKALADEAFKKYVTGRFSGMLLPISLIIYIIMIWPLFLKKGTVGNNNYGADPLATN